MMSNKSLNAIEFIASGLKVPTSLWFCVLLGVIVSSSVLAQDKGFKPAMRVENGSLANQQNAVNKLRDLYFKRDFEGGYENGRGLIERFPSNVELQSWFVLSMARNGMSEEAVELARQLTENHKTDGWAWFALATAYSFNNQYKESFEAGEKSLAFDPDNQEFILGHAAFLMNLGRYDELYIWLDKNLSKVKDQSRLSVVKGQALYRESQLPKYQNEPAKKNRSFEALAGAAKLAPDSANANYVYGLYLNREKRFAEAGPILKTAVRSSPKSLQIRQEFWKVIQNYPNKSEGQRTNELIAEMKAFLRVNPASPKTMEAVINKYAELKMPDEKKKYEQILLKTFPFSGEAEWILTQRRRAFSKNNSVEGVFESETRKAEYIKMLYGYVNRRSHQRKLYLGEAFAELFFHLKDDKRVPNQKVLQFAESMFRYETPSNPPFATQAALAVAERGLYDDAEKIAKSGFDKNKRYIESQRLFISDEKILTSNLDYQNSNVHDALGWTFFKAGRYNEAEKEMLEAEKLNKNSAQIFNHLGQFYEAQEQFDRAEEYYLKGYATDSVTNPNEESIKALYRKRRGNSEGFEIFFEKYREAERTARREKILAQKIKLPAKAVPFTLQNLRGETVAFNDLKGKIVVVNIWGVWCGPCVKEMPDIQELHKRYAVDDEVRILTIDSGDELEIVKKFMSDRKYDFPVLIDKDYLARTPDFGGEIRTFPTTWFIDRQGTIAYLEKGYKKNTLEQFTWRIEDLKTERK